MRYSTWLSARDAREVRSAETVLEQQVDDLADFGAREDLGQGHGQGKGQSPARRTMPPHGEATQALDDHAVDAQDGERANMWMVMLCGMRLPSTTSLPSHATKPKASTPSKASKVVRRSRDSAAAIKQEQRGDAREGAQAAVDEFNPGVGSVEGGVVVFEVRLPLATGTLHVEVAGHKRGLGHPQRVVFDEHAALVVLGPGGPRHLRGFGGGHEQPKALGPVRTPHAASRHAHHAAGQDHEEGQPKRGARQAEAALHSWVHGRFTVVGHRHAVHGIHAVADGRHFGHQRFRIHHLGIVFDDGHIQFAVFFEIDGG